MEKAAILALFLHRIFMSVHTRGEAKRSVGDIDFRLFARCILASTGQKRLIGQKRFGSWTSFLSIEESWQPEVPDHCKGFCALLNGQALGSGSAIMLQDGKRGSQMYLIT